jgi:hypothetical protein
MEGLLLKLLISAQFVYKHGRHRQFLFLIGWDEMSNLYRGPAIDVSYQVLIHLAKQFQRRRFLKIGQSETPPMVAIAKLV